MSPRAAAAGGRARRSRPSGPRRTTGVPSRANLYKRVPFLAAFWRDGQLYVRNYLTLAERDASPLVIAVLSATTEWRSLADIRRAVPSAARELETLVAELRDLHFLESSSDEPDSRVAKMRLWESWSPDAAMLHFSTQNAAPSSPSEVQERIFSRLAYDPWPPLVDGARAGGRGIALPPFTAAGAFPRVLTSRRSWRRFAGRPVTLGDLSTLLGLTWGVQRWMHIAPGVVLPLKTSPSGGACHSLEVYVAAQRIAGLPRGIYHYHPDAHRLRRVRAALSRRRIVEYVAGQRWVENSAALFVMTSVVPRVQWKYRFARAYRVLLLEAGHFCQTFCLAATWLGLAPFCTAALRASAIERDLNIDGIEETVIYAAGVGVRPNDRWAPFPSRTDAPPTSRPAYARRPRIAPTSGKRQ